MKQCFPAGMMKRKDVSFTSQTERRIKMKKLHSKQLRTIRILIIISGMLISFCIWLFLPDVIKNNALYHVGNGKFGSKAGMLLIVLIPLFGFIPCRTGEEIHTEDPVERAELQEGSDKRAEEMQLGIALFCTVTACLVMLGGLYFC